VVLAALQLLVAGVGVVPVQAQSNLRTSPTEVTVEEGKTAGRLWVWMRAQPSGDVTVTMTSRDTTIATVTPDTLVFTPTSWNITAAKRPRVTGVADDTSGDRTTWIDFTLDGGGFDNVRSDSLKGTGTDPPPPPPPGITLSPSTLTIPEDEEASYTVVLNVEPTADVEVTPYINVGYASDLVVSDTLTFTTANWNVPQTVTIRALGDDIVNAQNANGQYGRLAEVWHTAVGGGYTGASLSWLTVAIADDDVGDLDTSHNSLTVQEGESFSYVVRLTKRPPSDVTVTPASRDETVATVGGPLTFTPDGWFDAQFVRVTGVADDAADPRHTWIDHTLDGGGFSNAEADSVSATVVDAPSPGATIVPARLTVREAAGTGEYTVVLNTAPTSETDVTVTPTSSDPSIATVSGPLTFTSTNWATPQTVTVTCTVTRSVKACHIMC